MHRFFRQLPTVLAVVAFVCVHHATSANNSQHCWANNVMTCCVRLHWPLEGLKFCSKKLIISYGQSVKVILHVEGTPFTFLFSAKTIVA